MDNSLRTQRDMITLESRNVNGALRALSKRLPNFVSSIKSFLSEKLGMAPTVGFELIKTQKVEKDFKTYKYSKANKLTVYIPPGLKVSYLEYLGVLEQSQQIVDGILEKVLDPYHLWLAENLTNPEKLSSLRPSLKIPGLVVHDLDQVKKSLAGCFHAKSSQTEVTYGSVVARHADFLEAAEKLNRINERYYSIDRQLITEKVEAISELLEKLVTNVEREAETYKVSGAVLGVFSETSYAIAEAVEHYSVQGFQLMSLTNAMADSVDKLERVFER